MELSGLQPCMAMEAKELEQCAVLLERHGRSLSTQDLDGLRDAYQQGLTLSGRIAVEGCVLPLLLYAFCDSPFLNDACFADTLCALLELFCMLKAETQDALSDEELMTAMAEVFNGPAQGSLEWLEGMSGAEWVRWVMKR